MHTNVAYLNENDDATKQNEQSNASAANHDQGTGLGKSGNLSFEDNIDIRLCIGARLIEKGILREQFNAQLKDELFVCES